MKDWINYYNNILNFDMFDRLADQSYEERMDKPDELSSCVGLISIAFQDLENKLSEGITKLIQVKSRIGDIVTANLSFRLKIDLFFSLVIELRNEYSFEKLNGEGFEQNYLNALRIALMKCNDLRNKVLHSTYIVSQNSKDLIRVKKTSKAKSGLKIINEEFDISHLLNIYDFIVSMEMEVDDFFIDFGKRNSVAQHRP